VITSRQLRGARCRRRRWRPDAPSIIMAVFAAAVANVSHSCGRPRRQHWPSSRPLPSLTSTRVGAIANPSRTTRGGSKRPRGTTLVDEGRAVVNGNVGVEYVSFLMVMQPTFIYISTPSIFIIILVNTPFNSIPLQSVRRKQYGSSHPKQSLRSIGIIIVLFVTLIWGSSRRMMSNPFNTAYCRENCACARRC